ncbi:glutamine-hydrolyzing carbamoyl-phosphate synthase small subunit [Psychroflexus sp. CAK57W]|uniref:glutamine-hydrolyzing carbamoyl-phosphate synthase small subunit n=1 Tax=Psychroflexus curvus TaxID=2873595 RepID=UPI001CCDBE2D|nr:glutamine-hydrolyzing carbamoyl-phosphate synthase small subunit [Psychroflexus curvus]MBZ9628199.1 glutamine-hydrolyzing carbamoyl-phosphate synthase small subunit [Psychroflexus curvus]MBZ9788238.1 glutamine-hydrolyzing carbamoyl-phosphate synthase small subunit [Psychroflexus curvus]
MKYNLKTPAVLLLADGTVFHGKTTEKFSSNRLGEICFNTGMTGYQEIFTDPSYFGQIMVTTNAHIGNYGVNSDESESDSVKISGLICKNFSFTPSRVNSDESLENFLEDAHLPVIFDVDTRALVSHIRKNGAMNAIMSTDTGDLDALMKELDQHPSMKGLELASKVSTKKAYTLGDKLSDHRIAVLDLGTKQNILRRLVDRGGFIKVFPYDSSFEDLMEWNPTGIVISNGPGDPEPLTSAIELAKKCISNEVPTFGICLGHQIIALSEGIPTLKMHTGHRGINHPIQNLKTGKSEITSQNHGFTIDKESTVNNSQVEISHIHLNDQSVAGVHIKGKPCFSVQYHPEAGPGPNDATYLFDDFFDMMSKQKVKA